MLDRLKAGFTRSTLMRCLWTFIEAATAFLLLRKGENIDIALLIGAIGAGLAAVKNLVFPPGSIVR